MIKIIFQQIVILSVLLLLASCSNLFAPVKTDIENHYEINTVPDVAMKRSHGGTLLVMRPETNPIYDTTQMAYTVRPYQVAYFSKNRWIRTPAQMIQPLIIKTLQNTHYFHAIVSPPLITQHQYILNTQILKLEQDFMCNPSLIRFTLRAELIRASTGRVIATKEFSVVRSAPENSPYGGVIAANQAVAVALQQVASFCLNNLS